MAAVLEPQVLGCNQFTIDLGFIPRSRFRVLKDAIPPAARRWQPDRQPPRALPVFGWKRRAIGPIYRVRTQLKTFSGLCQPLPDRCHRPVHRWVGYSWNSFLLYVKGGAAVTQDKYEIFLTGPQGPLPTGFIAARGSETRWGGVVGVGAEYGFTPNWSFALEYNHLFMGSRDVGITFDPAFIAALNHSERIRQDVDMVTARINYRFGGPVIAKY
jgi:hypothetical protein